MSESHYSNAMTEIALALAIAFFSIMVLTMLSMGAEFQSVPSVAAAAERLELAPSALPAEGAAGNVTAAETVLLHYDGRFLDTDLGNVLVRKIRPLFEDSEVSVTFSESSSSELPNPYTLVFANFCDDADVLEIEEYLVAFSGYRHYRPIRALQCNHEYWYESHANSARLLRNIKKMMDHLDIDARVTFSGGVFTAEKITSR